MSGAVPDVERLLTLRGLVADTPGETTAVARPLSRDCALQPLAETQVSPQHPFHQAVPRRCRLPIRPHHSPFEPVLHLPLRGSGGAALADLRSGGGAGHLVTGAVAPAVQTQPVQRLLRLGEAAAQNDLQIINRFLSPLFARWHAANPFSAVARWWAPCHRAASASVPGAGVCAALRGCQARGPSPAAGSGQS